ncbi:MAG: hypothetical protein B7X35_06760 [Halothiobacillus sp. 14-56-357]|jgi:competence protein ComEA|nr:MAG: hypothetical protein B7X44_09665 [Halothiobacillus sp. 15-55-196]OZB56161.1 MAG: hypothetical protein B7X35_06760 [Halothiobacillus sp. 14-56-357]OZB77552.1 MAG: hypothetical protein B7X29_08160 [Halothiobacillus sp. 13-55-115]
MFRAIMLGCLLVVGMVNAPTYAVEKINLNTATQAQLDEVKGIGPKLSAAIVAYREAHHGFKSVDELKDVKGIGDKSFLKLKDHFVVDGQQKPAAAKK